MKNINWLKIGGFILVTELVGAISALFSGNIPKLYQSLIKPPLSPPAWVYGVVWVILFALMGLSFYLALRDSGREKNQVIGIYVLQLTLNFFWSIIFFRFGNYWLALIDLLLLIIAVYIMSSIFKKINFNAGLLLYPYLLWLLYAGYLNLGIALLN